MKLIVYKYDNIKRAGELINLLTASGARNFRLLAEMADILDTGELCEEIEKVGVQGKYEKPKWRKENDGKISKTLQKD